MSIRSERVILKLSGELFGENGNHIDFDKYDLVARRLIAIKEESKAQIAVVVGGGNIFRGRQAGSMVDPAQADMMGMLATVQNGVGLREALIRNGDTDARLMTAFNLPEMAEPYIINKGLHHLSHGRTVIIAGGLGRPGFSTDSAVAQCANELQCRLVLKASTVNGVYDSDPHTNPNAVKYQEVSYAEALHNRLAVMDMTAFAMCMGSKIPIFVFDIKDLARIPDAIRGDYTFGTIVR